MWLRLSPLVATRSWVRHFSRSPPAQCSYSPSQSSRGNDYKYKDIKSNFQWQVPARFNFAQDVIDARAQEDADDNPGHLAFHHVSADGLTETQWTYRELSDRSKQCANALRKLSDADRPMKRAVTILPKIPEWWLLNVAAMRTGTVLFPGTSLLTAQDILKRLEKAEADCVIGDAEVAAKVQQIEAQLSHPLKYKILALTGSAEDARLVDEAGWTPLQDLVAQQGGSPADCPRLDTPGCDVVQVYFTSGTTGDPKMVPHTQASYGYCHWVTGRYWLDLTPADLHWNISDPGWAKSSWSNVFAPWSQGATVFVHGMNRFTPLNVLDVLHRYNITTLCAPPTLYRSLVQEDLTKYPFHHLRHCVSAGEPLNEEVIHSWEERTGHLIKEGYGQTETTLLAGTFKGMNVRPGSMGKAAPGYDVRIVDNMGKEVERGEQGNIGIYCRPHRPPGLFESYIGEPEKTEYAFSGDYYLTGDRGMMDEDDYIWFAARDDDIIISAGYRIGPFEVESALLEHPAVAESAVVASPDVKRGQVVKAFVVLAENHVSQNSGGGNSQLTKELQDFVKKKTAPYKYPRRIEYVTALPKTVSGKIKRAELRKKEKKKATL